VRSRNRGRSAGLDRVHAERVARRPSLSARARSRGRARRRRSSLSARRTAHPRAGAGSPGPEAGEHSTGPKMASAHSRPRAHAGRRCRDRDDALGLGRERARRPMCTGTPTAGARRRSASSRSVTQCARSSSVTRLPQAGEDEAAGGRHASKPMCRWERTGAWEHPCVIDLIGRCWSQESGQRLSFHEIVHGFEVIGYKLFALLPGLHCWLTCARGCHDYPELSAVQSRPRRSESERRDLAARLKRREAANRGVAAEPRDR